MQMPYQYGTEEWDTAYADTVEKRKASEPQPYIMMSPEWISMYESAIQADAKYKDLAKGWEGTVVMHVEGKSEYGIDDDLFILMDLWHGDCRSLKLVPRSAGEAGDFVITGSMDRWIQVGKKQLDVVKGMMQGKLKLKGKLPTIVRYVRASSRLVDISTEVSGRFPDEMTAEELEGLREWIVPLREEFGV